MKYRHLKNSLMLAFSFMLILGALPQNFTHAFAALSAASPALLASPALVSNPGFEDGIEGWNVDPATDEYGSIESSSSIARTGERSMLFWDKTSGESGTGHFRVLSEPIPVSAGDNVTVTAYVYKEKAEDQSHGIQPVIHFYNSDGRDLQPNAFTNYSSNSIKTGEWTPITVSATTSESVSYIKVGLYSGFPSLTKVYVDDFSVTIESAEPEPQPNPETGNILPNPGFENGLEGWTQAGSGILEPSTEVVRGGTNSLYFYDNSSGTSLRVDSELFPVSPGDVMEASAQVYKLQQTHNIVYQIYFYSSDRTAISGATVQEFHAPASIPERSWHTIQASATAPDNAAYAKIAINSGGVSITEAYFDDFEVVLNPSAPQDEIRPELYNPGFDLPLEDGQIPGWSVGPGTEGTMELRQDITLSPPNSLYFEDPSTSQAFRVWSDKFSVTPEESLIVTSNVYVITQSHNIVGEIYYYDVSGTQISVMQELFGSVTLGSEKWSEMRMFSIVPDNAVAARVALYSGAPSETKAYFDDISIQTIPPDAPLDREYNDPVDLGAMVHVNLGQAGAVQTNANGENEVYFISNGLPGTFYALDGETGKLKFKEIIPNTEATWAMTIGDDQNVYFASTVNGMLYRYLPVEQRIENLGYNTADNWVWDIEAMDGKIYGGTYNSETYGKVFEYDIASNTYRNYGVVQEGQHYVRGLDVDEEFIYAGLGTTIELFKIDRESGEITEIVIPGYSGETGSIADVFKIGNKLFVSVSTINMVVLDLETGTIDSSFQYSNMISEPYPEDPNFIYYKDVTKLYKYDIKDKKTIEIPLSVPLPDTTRVKDMSWIELTSGEKAGETVLAMVTQYGEYILYDPVDHWVSFVQLDIDPQPVRIQGIEVGFDGRLYLGGYQRGASIYNPFTDEIELNIPTFAQPEGIGFLNDKVYYGTYVAAVMYSYDPTVPVILNENPQLEYQISHQDRPFAITSGDDKLFVGTVPDYGFLGGALAVYDDVEKTWKQYEHTEVVKNQSIIGLAYKDGLLYGGTSVWGGLGIDPSEPEAKMFIWDVEKGVKIEEFTLDIPGIDENPRMIGELSFGPDGLLWGAVDGTIFAMDVESKEIVKSKLIRPSTYNTSKWMPFHLRWAPDGMLYTTLSRKIIAIEPETLQHKIIVDDFLNSMTVGIDGSIYYAPDAGVNMAKIEIPETDATLSAIKLDGKPLSNFSPGILNYSLTLADMDMDAQITAEANKAGATVQIEDLRKSDQKTVISVTATDGKSKLAYTIHWDKDDTGPGPGPDPDPDPDRDAELKAAILAAIDAIEKLPANIKLSDRADVQAARAKVRKALALGASEADIANLDKLIAAEERIAQLLDRDIQRNKAIQEAITAIEQLPANIRLSDRADVQAARAKVRKALALGASEADIANLDKLIAAEERIRRLQRSANGPGFIDIPGPGSGTDRSDDSKLVIGLEDIEQAVEGEIITLAVPDDKTSIVLDADAVSALNGRAMELQTDSFSLEIPSELLEQLQEQAATEGIQDGEIEIAFRPLSAQVTGDILQAMQQNSGANLTLSGNMIELSLTMGTDEDTTSLDGFTAPVKMNWRVDPSLNSDLVGIYRIGDDGSYEYIGGTYSDGYLQAELHYSGKYAVLEFHKSFNDVPATHWAKDIIEQLTAKHIISGTSQTTFSPERSITRAEFTALIVRALNLTATGAMDFADVTEEDWYAEEIALAVHAGLVNGKTADQFDPNGNITREEMITILMRAYTHNGQTEPDTSQATEFKDEDAVSSWAAASVRAAAALNLINGREENLFVPKGISTRAEAAAVLNRIF